MSVSHAMSTTLGIRAAIGATLVLGLAASSPDADLIAAAFPPWWTSARAFQAAGGAGRIVATGRFASVLIVRGERAGVAERPRRAGALFALDAGAFGGCVGSKLEGKT